MQDTPKPKGLTQLIDDAARERRYMLQSEGNYAFYWRIKMLAAFDKLREHCQSDYKYNLAWEKAIRDSEMPTMAWIHEMVGE